MEELYELKEMLCDELKSYAKRSDYSISAVSKIDTLAHAVKNIYKILQMSGEEASYVKEYGSKKHAEPERNVVAEKLHDILNDAPDQRTRDMIQSLIDRM